MPNDFYSDEERKKYLEYENETCLLQLEKIAEEEYIFNLSINFPEILSKQYN